MRKEGGREMGGEREWGEGRERESDWEKDRIKLSCSKKNIHKVYIIPFCISIFFTAHMGAPGGGRESEGCTTVLTFFATSPIVWCCCFVWSRSSKTPMNSSSSMRTELYACKVYYIIIQSCKNITHWKSARVVCARLYRWDFLGHPILQ